MSVLAGEGRRDETAWPIDVGRSTEGEQVRRPLYYNSPIATTFNGFLNGVNFDLHKQFSNNDLLKSSGISTRTK